MSTRELTFAQAIREALDEELARDPNIFILGEDVGAWGGVFRCTEGLFDKYGPERVIDTPLSEEGFVGLAVGAAMTGMHPVPEIMFGDFITLVMDQIVNQAAKMRYMTGGQVQVPITLRATMGGGRSSGAQHSQSWHAWFAHVPGLKVVVPSTPYDAKGLLKTALRDPNPVLFFEDKVMYTKVKGPVPEEEYMLENPRMKTMDLYPLSKTPLKLLLAERIDLSGNRVRSVREEDDQTVIQLVDKSAFGNARITLKFDPSSYELKEWTITDAQGKNTTVMIFNVQQGVKLDQKLFAIDYKKNLEVNKRNSNR